MGWMVNHFINWTGQLKVDIIVFQVYLYKQTLGQFQYVWDILGQ